MESLTSYSKELRSEIEKLRTEREAEVFSLRSQWREETEEERQRLLSEIGDLRGSLDDALNRNAALESAMQSQEESAEGRSRLTVETGESLVRLGTSLSEVCGMIESYQQSLLPSFTPPAEADLNVEKLPADEFGIGEQTMRIERAVRILQMVVDAKMETLSLMRVKLKEENFGLKSKLDAVESKTVDSAATQKIAAEQFENERSGIRQEIRDLESLYEEKICEMRKELETSKDAAGTETQRASQAAEENAALTSKVGKLTAEASDLSERLERDHEARAQLASELSSERRSLQTLREEHEKLKLTQKYVGGASDGRLSGEKFDVMRTMDRLITENTSLKQKVLLLETEAQMAKRERVERQHEVSISDREVMMAATDKLSANEIAGKIARRTMAEVSAGGASSAASSSLTAAALKRSGSGR